MKKLYLVISYRFWNTIKVRYVTDNLSKALDVFKKLIKNSQDGFGYEINEFYLDKCYAGMNGEDVILGVDIYANGKCILQNRIAEFRNVTKNEILNIKVEDLYD